MRIVLGLVAGVIAAFASVFVVETVGNLFYPIPAEVDLYDPEQMRAVFARMPLGAHLLVVTAWFLGALIGGSVGHWLSRVRWVAWVIAGLMVLAGVVNILLLPHPAWMQFAAVIAPLLGGLIAAHVVKPRATADTAGPVNDPAN